MAALSLMVTALVASCGARTAPVRPASRATVDVAPAPSASPSQNPAATDGEERAPGGRAWLGVELSKASASEPGVLVRNVVRNAPAAQAGLESGDRIVEIDGQTVNAPDDVIALVAQHRAGDRVNVAFKRAGDYRLAAATLARLPASDEVMRLNFVGTKAPPWVDLKTVQGSVAPRFDALGGQIVVLEFWASWCGVCPILVPTMNDWYGRLGPEGVAVVGITSERVGTALGAATQLGMQYPLLADETGETTESYRALALPTVFVIDRTGTVRDVMVGYSGARVSELDALITRLIAEK